MKAEKYFKSVFLIDKKLHDACLRSLSQNIFKVEVYILFVIENVLLDDFLGN